MIRGTMRVAVIGRFRSHSRGMLRLLVPATLLAPMLHPGCTARTAAVAPAASTEAVAAELFDLRSGFWINLHHHLYSEAQRRSRNGVQAAAADSVRLAAAPEHERQLWEAAVETYRLEVVQRPLFDAALIGVKNSLAAWERPGLDGAGLPAALVAALEQAAPLYRSAWWPAHDSANAAWIGAVRPLLERHGARLAGRVAGAFRTEWPARPVTVDVVAAVPWPGAYTTIRPAHIVISSTRAEYGGTLALEMLFHEALHTMDDAVRAAYRDVQGDVTEDGSPDAVHALIFFTAGELTRAEIPDHRPFMEALGVAERGGLAAWFPPIREHWSAYLEGSSSFEDALRAIARSRAMR